MSSEFLSFFHGAWIKDMLNNNVTTGCLGKGKILTSYLQAWIMDKLEDGKTKVVVVDSSLANQSLSLNSGEVLKVMVKERDDNVTWQ